MLHYDPRQYVMSSPKMYSGVRHTITLMVRWKLTRASLMSCLQGWSVSRMKRCRRDSVPAQQRKSPTRALWARRSRPQATLRNAQPGSEIKAVLKRRSDWKKPKPLDEVSISVKVGEHCAKGVQQFYMFGTPDRYEEKNIDSVIRYISSLEGTEQVNVPVLPESKLSGPPSHAEAQ